MTLVPRPSELQKFFVGACSDSANTKYEATRRQLVPKCSTTAVCLLGRLTIVQPAPPAAGAQRGRQALYSNLAPNMLIFVES